MLDLVNIFMDNHFLVRGLVAYVGISFICPILGIFLILKRMSLIGDAISHAILPGVALGFMFGGMSIIFMALGGLIAGLVVTILAGVVSRNTNIKEDASFAGFYLMSLALGVIIISHSGTNLDLIHILFGSILAVNKEGLVIIGGVVTFSLVVLVLILRPLVVDIFDASILKIFGSNAKYYHLILLFLIVVNLVIEFQILGTVLVIGLMMLPATIAKLLAKSLNYMFVVAICASLGASIIGILVSYQFDLATGPSIILVCGIFYLLTLAYVHLKAKIAKYSYNF